MSERERGEEGSRGQAVRRGGEGVVHSWRERNAERR